MLCFYVFFFNDTATTEIYTLSLHDALPISFDFTYDQVQVTQLVPKTAREGEVITIKGAFFLPEPTQNRVTINGVVAEVTTATDRDRKSTRLNSSHTVISYAVFCLKKKKQNKHTL